MTTGLTLRDKPSIIITDSGLGRSRHTATVATEVSHGKLILCSDLPSVHEARQPNKPSTEMM